MIRLFGMRRGGRDEARTSRRQHVWTDYRCLAELSAVYLNTSGHTVSTLTDSP